MTALVCSPNAATAYDFFLAKGLRNFQAAAIVGNLQQESGINPALQALDRNGKPSRGVAMWQPARWNQLVAFAGSGNPWALGTQLEFLWAELPSYGLSQLLATTTLEDATRVFQDSFERCGDCMPQNRIAYAQSVLYSCQGVTPPSSKKKGGWIIAVAAVATVVAVAGAFVYYAPREEEIEPLYPDGEDW